MAESVWIIDENGDLTVEESPSTKGLWEVDSDDILPINSGTDLYWVIDGDDIVHLWIKYASGEGGAVAGAESIPVFHHRYIVSSASGAVAGGTATVKLIDITEVVGGAVGGGAAIVSNKVVWLASGGVVAGGAPQYKFAGLNQWYRGTVTVTKDSDVVTGKDTKWNLYIKKDKLLK